VVGPSRLVETALVHKLYIQKSILQNVRTENLGRDES